MSLPSVTNSKDEYPHEVPVLYASGLVTANEAAALRGISVDEFLTELEDPALLSQIETHAAQMKTSGKLSEARALALLDRLLVNIESQIDELSPTAATRVAEMLLKISGLQEKRSSELKLTVPQGPGFSINIILPESKHEKVAPLTTYDGEAVEVDRE